MVRGSYGLRSLGLGLGFKGFRDLGLSLRLGLSGSSQARLYTLSDMGLLSRISRWRNGANSEATGLRPLGLTL